MQNSENRKGRLAWIKTLSVPITILFCFSSLCRMSARSNYRPRKKLTFGKRNVIQLRVTCYYFRISEKKLKIHFLLRIVLFLSSRFLKTFFAFILLPVAVSLLRRCWHLFVWPPSVSKLSECLLLVDACQLWAPQALISRSLMVSQGCWGASH